MHRTLRSRLFSCAPLAVVGLVVLGVACTAETSDRFPCGAHAGSCKRGSEVCIFLQKNNCSTCVPVPAECNGKAACGCLPPADSTSFTDQRCTDPGTCSEAEGGPVLTCKDAVWSCG